MAQNQLSKWYFGNYAALDFSTVPPTILNNSAMNATFCSSSIADAAGNLQFYTNGNTVWNKAHVVMANGTGLINATASEQPIIVKQPGNSNIYFIFTQGTLSLTVAYALFYSVVDMSLAAGLGSVTAQNIMLSSIYVDAVAATKHCNGRDVWLIKHEYSPTPTTGLNFEAYLITAAGVNPVPVSSPLVYCGAISSRLAASQNGKKLAITDNGCCGSLTLVDFDNTTGIVSNSLALQTGYQNVEFSADGTKLYALQPHAFTQWDLCAGSPAGILASSYTITTPNQVSDIQLAINGKIYLSVLGQPFLDVINSPGLTGAACNYVSAAQSIAPNICEYSLPTFVSGIEVPETPFTHSVSNSYGCQTVSFTPAAFVQNYTVTNCTASGYSLTGFIWNFGDPASGAANTSTLTSPLHVYSSLGTYTAELILNYNCNATDTVRQVVQVNQTCISVASTAISCASLGSATVTALVGTGPFSYTWMPSAQTSSVATNLSPGNYFVSVFDFATNLTYTASTYLAPLIPFTGSVVASSSVACNGAATGTASIVNLAGGSGNENYLWSGPSVAYVTASVSNLVAGNWSVVVTDALTGCQVSQGFTITQPPALSLTVSAGSYSACAGTAVVLTGTCSGGTPVSSGYAYSWVAGPAVSTQTVNQALAGNYTYTLNVLDSNNCQASRTITIHFDQPPNLNISLSSATACAEAFNGSANTITLTAGGAASYTISTPNDIYNSNPSGPATNLNTLPPHMPGASTATLYGSNGACTLSTTVVFTIIPNPTVSVSNPTPVICAGQSYTYTNAGADSYTWSSSTPGQTVYTTGSIAVADPTANAVFSVFGGSLGCNSPLQSTTITVNPLPVVSVQPNPAIICLNSAVTLTASGTATSYSWQPPYGLSADQGSTVVAAPSSGQSYTVVGSLNNCTASAMVTVSVLPLPDVTITGNTQTILCLNQSFSLQAHGGTGYAWQYPNHLTASGPSVQVIPADVSYSGTYTLTGTGINNCSNTATVNMLVEDSPNGYLKSDQLQGCVPLCGDYQFVATNFSQQDVTVTGWQINNETVLPQASFHRCFTSAGNYAIKSNLVSVHGCANTITFTVTAYAQPAADFTFTPENPVENFDPVNFTPFKDQTITDFNWYFVNNDPNNSSSSAAPDYLFKTAGTYPVTLIVRNQWGCADSVVKTITVAPDFVVYIPNAFTPNADGKNELFMPVMRGVHEFTFYVFNRWGELLFKTSDIMSGWDGNYNGQLCQQDEYVWKLVLNSQGNSTEERQERRLTGQVLLYR
jgi:gliding motility-associated-like protein